MEYIDGMNRIQKDNLDNLVERERGLFLLKLSKLVDERMEVLNQNDVEIGINLVFEEKVMVEYGVDTIEPIQNLYAQFTQNGKDIQVLKNIRDWVDSELSDIE